MTRFLPALLSGPDAGALNEETERLFAYHQATKHTYQSVRANVRYLDWHNQPDPFRRFEDAPLIALPPEANLTEAGAFATMAALRGGWFAERFSPERPLLDAAWLSRLLWHSMATSAWKRVPATGDRYGLRVNPSSGNLHPTETYLAPQGFAGIADGLYHYRADVHALEVRSYGAWNRQLAGDLSISPLGQPSLLVIFTSIFWREAWKYGNRAYRYCCHDLGHATMSILLAATAAGMPGGAVGHFSDLALNRALGLAESDEAPMLFLALASADSVKESSAGQVAGTPPAFLPGVPNQLSPTEIRYELLMGMHRSTVLPDPAGPLPGVPDRPLARESWAEPLRDTPLGPAVRRRRSALDFDAGASVMTRKEMEQMLDFATRDWLADWRGNFGAGGNEKLSGADFVTLYLYVHRVRDCAPGVYRWDGVERTLEQLYLGNVDRVAAFLSLEQSLAGNACFAVSMIADLEKSSRIFGNRGYRYAYFEAGAIGQRLYVGAEALGWNATGIGAFYDDDVHRYLGFLEEGESSVAESVQKAEQAALVMLGSPASRAGAPAHYPEQSHRAFRLPDDRVSLGIGESSPNPPKDSSRLPRQVIYHFAVGRAIHDPRVE